MSSKGFSVAQHLMIETDRVVTRQSPRSRRPRKVRCFLEQMTAFLGVCVVRPPKEQSNTLDKRHRPRD